MSSITIAKTDLTTMTVDCIVNAANSRLAMGGGVCGAIFRAAGPHELQNACDEIGHCPTGGAVITPGFALKARYVIHAVGPIWQGGNNHEAEDLYGCYRSSLDRAYENDCHSIGFPLISSGIFGYPKEQAWRKALQSCNDWIKSHPDFDIKIVFAVLDDKILDLGFKTMKELGITNDEPEEEDFVFFWKLGHKNEEFSNWYPGKFTIEGITYDSVEQYMIKKKAILFGDFPVFNSIMVSVDPAECKDLGKIVSGFESELWDSCKYEIVYNGNYAKFSQNPDLMEKLIATGNAILAEASPHDRIWGIGMSQYDPDARNPRQWKGENLLGKILMQIRDEFNHDRIAWFKKYIPILQMIDNDEDLKSACKEYSVYGGETNTHRSVTSYLYRDFMHEAYDSNIVIKNYSEIVKKCGTENEIAKPTQGFIDALTADQVLACIAWHFRRDHFIEGSLVNDSIAEGYMLLMMKCYLSKLNNRE